MSYVAHQARAYPSVSCMKRLGVFLLLLDGMLVRHMLTRGIEFASSCHHPELKHEVLCWEASA